MWQTFRNGVARWKGIRGRSNNYNEKHDINSNKIIIMRIENYLIHYFFKKYRSSCKAAVVHERRTTSSFSSSLNRGLLSTNSTNVVILKYCKAIAGVIEAKVM